MTNTAKRNIPVVRNGISINIQDIEETRGKGAGTTYLGTSDTFSLDDYSKIMGTDYILSVLDKKVKAFLKDIYYEVTHRALDNGDGTKKEEEIPFVESVFMASVANTPFVTESLKAMNERVKALFYQMLDLPDDGSDATKQKNASYRSQIQALRNSIERKMRAAAVEAADED